MENKTTRFLVLKIIGFACLATFVAGIVLFVTNLGSTEFNSGMFVAAMLMMMLGLLCGAPCLFFGFSPSLSKARASVMQRLHEQNIEIYRAFSTEATHQGSEGKMYCKHCGVQIDVDSRFCKFCGKEL